MLCRSHRPRCFHPAGNYYLAFFAGSYDKTGGGELGATMQIKAFRLLPAGCTVDSKCTARKAPPVNCTSVACVYPNKDTNGDPSDGCEAEERNVNTRHAGQNTRM